MIEKIGRFLQTIIFGKYESCYSEQEYSGNAVFGICGGLAGGTSSTEYLSESCIGCPYFYLNKRRKI